MFTSFFSLAICLVTDRSVSISNAFGSFCGNTRANTFGSDAEEDAVADASTLARFALSPRSPLLPTDESPLFDCCEGRVFGVVKKSSALSTSSNSLFFK